MNNPRRVQIGTAAYDVYIGRGPRETCPWGNPFRIGVHGTRSAVIAKYNVWIRTQPDLMARLPELKDKVLGCHCRADQRCHGETLLKLLAEQGIEPAADHPTP